MSDPRITDEPLPGLYDDPRTLTIAGSINHEVVITLGNQEPFYTWAEDLVAAANRAAYEANLAPQPVVDREALVKALRAELVLQGVDEFHDPAPLGRYLADAVLALLNGTAK